MSMYRRGLIRAEILVVVLCVLVALVLIATLIPAPRRGRDEVYRIKDAAQLRAIHQSIVVASRDFNGIYPTPGLSERKPIDGVTEPGRGEEDITQNTTANLYSVMIMNNWFTPEMCVGPSEPSAKVVVVCENYNYEAYDSAGGVHWDRGFKADLHTLSHVSYAHMPLSADLKLNQWRDTSSAEWPILGNRGPLGGAPDPQSITNKIHKPHDRWSGNIVYQDNSVRFTEEFPCASKREWTIAPECIPRDRAVPDTQAMITFTKQMTEDGPIIQHD